MNMKAYALGALSAFIVALMIFLIFRVTGKRKCADYDERQQQFRDKGCRFGFYTMLIFVMSYSLLVVVAERTFLESSLFGWMAGLLGVSVFAIYCIWNGAFFTLKRRPVAYIVLTGCVGLTNLINGIRHIRKGDMLENGLFTFQCVNLVTAVGFFAIFAAIVLRLLIPESSEE